MNLKTKIEIWAPSIYDTQNSKTLDRMKFVKQPNSSQVKNDRGPIIDEAKEEENEIQRMDMEKVRSSL